MKPNTNRRNACYRGFSADSVDRNTQNLWLWLDTFQGDVADSDDVRKLAKSLDIEPDAFRKMKDGVLLVRHYDAAARRTTSLPERRYLLMKAARLRRPRPAAADPSA